MIIAIAGNKGGVGKSTFACSLATLINQRGHSPVLLDMDELGTSLNWAMQRAEHTPTGSTNWFPVLGPPDNLAKELFAHKHGRSGRHIILDLPGGENSDTTIAIGMSDLVILPMAPSQVELDSLINVHHLLAGIRTATGVDVTTRVLLTNCAHNRPRDRRDAREYVRLAGFQALAQHLTSYRIYCTAMSEGFGVTESDNDKAATEFSTVCDEILATNWIQNEITMPAK